jgi:hypothetical protein
MDADRFDHLTIRLQRAVDRRRAVSILAAGSTTLAGLRSTADARKRRKRKKKRCGRLQAKCRSNKDCCSGKTGRVCASNDKDVQCRGGGTVCCLPLNAFGCNDFCDCCGGNTGCNDSGQCRILF